MIRGTTPKHTFSLPFSTDLVKVARVIYSQNSEPVLIKTGDDLTLAGNSIELILTQAETFLFKCARPFEVQVRVLTHGGEALNSDILKVPVGRCLENEVLA